MEPIFVQGPETRLLLGGIDMFLCIAFVGVAEDTDAVGKGLDIRGQLSFGNWKRGDKYNDKRFDIKM